MTLKELPVGKKFSTFHKDSPIYVKTKDKKFGTAISNCIFYDEENVVCAYVDERFDIQPVK